MCAKNVKAVARLGIVSFACLCLAACGGGSGSTSTSNAASMPAVPQVQIAPTQNPLVAQATVQVAGAANAAQAMMEFGPTTAYGRQTATYPLTGGNGAATFLVAGMRPSTTYHMRAHVIWNAGGTDWTGSDQTFTTGPLPTKLTFGPLIVSRPNPSLSSTESPGVELLSLIPPLPSNIVSCVVADRDGNPIWYYDVGSLEGNYPEPIKIMPNGDMIIMIENYLTGTVSMREIDLAGNIVHSLTVAQLQSKLQAAGFSLLPDGFSHDVLLLNNGHLVMVVASQQSFTNLPGYPGTVTVEGDGLVDLDENWTPVWTWSAFDYLDINRHLAGLPDWTHANAVIYSPNDGNILLSLRHQAWLIKIDYENGAGTGAVLWRLGYQGDFTLTNGTDPSLWFYFQHGPSLISQSGGQDTLAIWDNGNDRVTDNPNALPCTPNGGAGCYSRATIFQLDQTLHTATLVWADAPGYFSSFGGNATQLADGNVEFDINSMSPMITPYIGAEVQEVALTPNSDIVWKMDVGYADAYRANRIPSLYPGVTWSK